MHVHHSQAVIAGGILFLFVPQSEEQLLLMEQYVACLLYTSDAADD